MDLSRGTARYKRMLHSARRAPELYENLMPKRGWTVGEFGTFVTNALAAALPD